MAQPSVIATSRWMNSTQSAGLISVKRITKYKAGVDCFGYPQCTGAINKDNRH
jgi:hypothetical protein